MERTHLESSLPLSMCVIFSKWRQENNSPNHWLIFTLLIFCHGSAIIRLVCDKRCSEETQGTRALELIVFIQFFSSWVSPLSQNPSCSCAADWIQECVDTTNLSLIFLTSGFGRHFIFLKCWECFYYLVSLVWCSPAGQSDELRDSSCGLLTLCSLFNTIYSVKWVALVKSAFPNMNLFCVCRHFNWF